MHVTESDSSAFSPKTFKQSIRNQKPLNLGGVGKVRVSIPDTDNSSGVLRKNSKANPEVLGFFALLKLQCSFSITNFLLFYICFFYELFMQKWLRLHCYSPVKNVILFQTHKSGLLDFQAPLKLSFPGSRLKRQKGCFKNRLLKTAFNHYEISPVFRFIYS